MTFNSPLAANPAASRPITDIDAFLAAFGTTGTVSGSDDVQGSSDEQDQHDDDALPVSSELLLPGPGSNSAAGEPGAGHPGAGQPGAEPIAPPPLLPPVGQGQPPAVPVGPGQPPAPVDQPPPPPVPEDQIMEPVSQPTDPAAGPGQGNGGPAGGADTGGQDDAMMVDDEPSSGPKSSSSSSSSSSSGSHSMFGSGSHGSSGFGFGGGGIGGGGVLDAGTFFAAGFVASVDEHTIFGTPAPLDQHSAGAPPEGPDSYTAWLNAEAMYNQAARAWNSLQSALLEVVERERICARQIDRAVTALASAESSAQHRAQNIAKNLQQIAEHNTTIARHGETIDGKLQRRGVVHIERADAEALMDSATAAIADARHFLNTSTVQAVRDEQMVIITAQEAIRQQQQNIVTHRGNEMGDLDEQVARLQNLVRVEEARKEWLQEQNRLIEGDHLPEQSYIGNLNRYIAAKTDLGYQLEAQFDDLQQGERPLKTTLAHASELMQSSSEFASYGAYLVQLVEVPDWDEILDSDDPLAPHDPAMPQLRFSFALAIEPSGSEAAATVAPTGASSALPADPVAVLEAAVSGALPHGEHAPVSDPQLAAFEVFLQEGTSEQDASDLTQAAATPVAYIALDDALNAGPRILIVGTPTNT